ncbi:XylR family transcriptional regulator [Planctomicrobium piriforme]|uniref:LacI family transcriptional regulator n=1 Tax=Planctomicrobium piriforme TaxID=1576369 RepID=A0A1I3IZE3_9PLAN|nr:DNA-binding transcriptional regulator [Planctomicrobium piriforme]SFI53196.1 LacI family transcriptional regulator [Planctomicrobium piriforme]
MRHVALLIETSRTYGRELLAGIRRYANEHGPWSMYLELRGLDSKPPAWLNRWHGDGILTRTGSLEMAQALERADVPTVELRTTRFHHRFPFVGVDNQALGRMVARHLLERGFRYFAVYDLDSEDYFTERGETFVQAIRAAGHDVHIFRSPDHREQPQEWEAHQDQLVEWLKALPKPVGIMACTDQLGYWLLDACVRAEIAVPEQAAVVGCENDETLCTMATPPLSSAAFDAQRIGYAAAKLLDGLMQGEPAPTAPLLIPPLQVVTRRSSDVVAIDDVVFSQAIRRMRESASQGLSIKEVLQSVPISRSTLERKTRSLLGRSPREEIFRIRLEIARQLLQETEMSLEQIAQRCGFRTAQYFCTAFLKSQGMTPGAFRKQSRGA